MADVSEMLKDAYEKVALWPENRMSAEGLEALGPGFNDLLVLRNIVPDAITEIEALRARLSQAGAGGGVVVKPLVWSEPAKLTNGCWTADCILGTFSVGFDDGWHACLEDGIRWEWEPEQDPRSYEGPYAAQAACQAFLNARIRAALSTPPAPSASVEGAENAAIAALWTMINPQKTETYEEFRQRDPIGWEEHEALGSAVARAVLASLTREAAHSYSPDYQAMGDCRICGHQPENCTGRKATPPAPSGEVVDHGLCGISADIESKRVLKLHFKHEVTDADRKAIIDAFNALNRERRALSNPAPGHGEAVPVAWRPVGQVEIDYDGFAGTIQGYYTTREGKHGVVVQQHGTRVVHVYGEKSIARLNAARPAEKPAKQEDGDV